MIFMIAREKSSNKGDPWGKAWYIKHKKLGIDAIYMYIEHYKNQIALVRINMVLRCQIYISTETREAHMEP